MIETHFYVQGGLDGRDRALELDVHGIAGATGHGKAVGFRETDQGVIILLAGAEPLGELLDREELPVGRAGRIVELSQETIQPFASGRTMSMRMDWVAGSRPTNGACPLTVTSRT